MTSGTNFLHHHRATVFWLIVNQGAGQDEVLTLDLDGEEGSEETLPVFCFEDEARMFLSQRVAEMLTRTVLGGYASSQRTFRRDLMYAICDGGQLQ